MWTGSSGPYRPQQPGQNGSSHPAWSAAGAHPARGAPSGSSDTARGAGGSSSRPLPPPPGKGRPTNGVGADGLPEPPKGFPELEQMSLKELRLLHDEKAKFEDFVSKHKYQREIDEIVSSVRADVENYEREHLEIADKMEEVVDDETLEALRKKIHDMEIRVSGLQRLKDEWLEHNSPERLMEKLRLAMRESETISEGLEKSMLSSSMNFDEFLAQYIACRKKYHERSLKLEQLRLEAKKKSFGR